jgi:hypothetical protein
VRLGKKGAGGFSILPAFILCIVTAGLILGAGFLIFGKLQGLATSDLANTSINDTMNALSPIASDWMPILVIVGIAGMLISVLLLAVTNYRGGRD